ncbi:MAG: winged helix-turn-helix domain-containing protein [Candidatus Bathyarchaeia archaeon]
MEERRRRRSRSEVICDILSEALGGVNKTRLMYRCNLNFARFNRYLQELVESGLVECVDGNPDGLVLYKTTVKGRELLQVLRKADDLLSI